MSPTTVINSFTPAPPPEVGGDLYGPEPYDYNFCTAVDFSRLETDRVALTPLIPRIHAPLWFEQASQDPSFEAWMSFRNDTLEQLLKRLEGWRRNPTQLVLAIIDKGRPGQAPIVPSGSFAGLIGLVRHSSQNLTTKMAPVMVFKPFQRTYVTSSAIGLLLRYCLEVPANGGLGLRRVEWTANALNAASVNAAVRMGFKHEATLRWSSILIDKEKVGDGRSLREGDPKPDKGGRDNEIFAFCWEDWEAAGRDLVQARLDRK
ncbi:acyl-CoA N-acyltransferase [Peniophora sp. CONT]|nr:acyl-CoA N-acyltransferase [Peniophora sp. CONT]